MCALQAFRASRLLRGQEHIHRPRPRLALCCRASAQPATHVARRPLDIAIVGSGIGGLTAAAALAETGANVRVFEARSQEEALAGPGGINLQANAEKVLRLLTAPWPPKAERSQPGTSPAQAPQGQAADSDATSSLSEAIYAVGGPILSGGFRDAKGNYLYYADVDSTGLKDIRSNGLSVSRTSLQTLLYNAVPPGSVAFGKTLADFAAPPPGEPGRVQLTFEDGSSTTCDVLVAADGMRSKVRSRLLFPDAPEELQYSGTVCWRGRLPLSAIGQGRDWFLKAVNNDTWGEYWGSGIRFGWFTVGREAALDPSSPGGIRTEGEEQLCWYAFLNRPRDWRPEPGADEAARLQAAFGGMAAPVPQMCAALGSYPMYVNKIVCHKPHPAPWGSGRVTLLGDSAHAMVPTLGQGGCMAIEDALELANQLGGATRQLEGQQGQQPGAGADYDTPAAVPALEAALRRYEEQRAPRAMRVSEQSLQVGQLAMADNPLTVWLRNTIYRMTPKSEGDKQFAYLFKDYTPAWQPGVRLNSSGGGAADQQRAGPAVVPSQAAGN